MPLVIDNVNNIDVFVLLWVLQWC